jgi:transposase InsO family protein
MKDSKGVSMVSLLLMTILALLGYISLGQRMKLKILSSHLHQELIVRAQCQLGLDMLAVTSNNGTEFKNLKMDGFFYSKGIIHEFSTPYSPQQNGVAKRKNRTLIEMARAMLDEYKTPLNIWAKAINTTCHAINQMFL